jgi:hypothetical protein
MKHIDWHGQKDIRIDWYQRPLKYNYTQTTLTEMEGSCLAGPGNPHSNNNGLQLANNEITAIFTLHPLTPIGSLPPKSQAIHVYISKANGIESYHYPNDGDGVCLQNVRKFESPDEAVIPRNYIENYKYSGYWFTI